MKMNVNIKEYCIDYFNRMKYYVLLSSVIFVAFLLLSYFYPSFFNSLMNQALQNMRDGVTNGEILLETKSGDTVCGIAENIGRDGEMKKIMSLSGLKDMQVDMFTTVFIGNSKTKKLGNVMVTPRGYGE
jgi:precorrin-3B C17-methyltransferase